MRRLRQKLHLLLACLLFIGSLLLSASPAFASTAINGGGSGFAGLEIQQWQADVNSPSRGSLTVDYSSQSSGIGRQYFASNTWDYGASDIRYIPGIEDALLKQMQNGRCGGRAPAQCFQYVPVSAGGLGFMYNLSNPDGSQLTSLKLTPADVCGIFTGRITSWRQISANNPSLANSSQPIIPVVRQDQAGESYVLSEFCMAEDPADWASFVNFQTTFSCTAGYDYQATDTAAFTAKPPQPIAVWPSVLMKGVQANGVAAGCQSVPTASGAEGVANTVHDPTQGPGSITYDAAGYAIVRQLPNAYVQNAAGVFTLPNATSVNVALAYASPVGDGTFNLDFGESSGADPRAYNPSTYSYVLAQTGGFDTGRGSTLGKFLCYAIGEGQSRAAALLYAPLSAQVEQIGLAAIVQIPGAPSSGQCLQGAPPPPPPVVLHKVTPVVRPVTSIPGVSKTSQSGGSGTATSSTGSGSRTSQSAASGSASGTAVGVSGGQAAGGGQAAAGSTDGGVPTGDQSSTLQQLPAVLATSSRSPTNYDLMVTILEGAAICAVGVALAGQRRRGGHGR